MIKLSDYLNYLYQEVVQARKNADEQAVLIAKAYAKHEYLKYFKVPRYVMPSVKLEVPLKISEIDADVKYDLRVYTDTFVRDVNSRIDLTNKLKNLNIKPLTANDLKTNSFELLKKDMRTSPVVFNQKLNLNQINLPKELNLDFKNMEFVKAEDSEEAQSEKYQIVIQALMDRRKLVSADLRQVFVDPNTMNETDKEKILLKMNVEMVEEGFQINSVKDENGNIIEQIIVD